MKLSVLGGVYHEYCFRPTWDNIYGSGLRAAMAIRSKTVDTEFITICSQRNPHSEMIDYCSKAFGFEVRRIACQDEPICFDYIDPIEAPSCSFTSQSINNVLGIEAKLLLKFGMMECSVQTNSSKVVYDPQNPDHPVLFDHDGSLAAQVVYVLNQGEAQKITGKKDLDDCSEHLLMQPNVVCCIIKCGFYGAYVATKYAKRWIPVYQSDNIWLIGSGDIFSAIFAYHWLSGETDFFQIANIASYSTAQYSNDKSLNFSTVSYSNLTAFKPLPETSGSHISTYKIYLASPFFNSTQYSYLLKILNILKKYDLNVFSPFHEIGVGDPLTIAEKDLKALKDSDLVLALLDDLDPGTIFEIGFARAREIQVMILSESLDEANSTMFIGSGCELYNDIATLLYTLIWKIVKN